MVKGRGLQRAEWCKRVNNENENEIDLYGVKLTSNLLKNDNVWLCNTISNINLIQNMNT